MKTKSTLMNSITVTTRVLPLTAKSYSKKTSESPAQSLWSVPQCRIKSKVPSLIDAAKRPIVGVLAKNALKACPR